MQTIKNSLISNQFLRLVYLDLRLCATKKELADYIYNSRFPHFSRSIASPVTGECIGFSVCYCVQAENRYHVLWYRWRGTSIVKLLFLWIQKYPISIAQCTNRSENSRHRIFFWLKKNAFLYLQAFIVVRTYREQLLLHIQCNSLYNWHCNWCLEITNKVHYILFYIVITANLYTVIDQWVCSNNNILLEFRILCYSTCTKRSAKKLQASKKEKNVYKSCIRFEYFYV